MANQKASRYIKSSKAAPKAWEVLERMGQEWYSCGCDSADAGRKKKLQNDIFIRLCGLCGEEWYSAIGTFLERDWQKFDPNKGTLEQYVRKRVWLRRKDDEKEEMGWCRVTGTDPDPVTGKKPRLWINPRAEDAPAEDEEERESLVEQLPASAACNPDEGGFIDETACQLLTLMLQMEINLQGKRGNSVRFRYFRMFFTSGVVDAVHTDGAPDAFLRRERDLFGVIYTRFLDYFMGSLCRSIAEILHTGLKPYGVLVEGRAMVETPLPLPHDVYIAYLKNEENYSAGHSAVSQQLDAYRKYLSTVLNGERA